MDDGHISKFGLLFSGNPGCHYVREAGAYRAVDHGITADDVARHLRGEEPSLLSIPIDPAGLSRFGCIDLDRHADLDAAVDHADLARRVTELGLPLVVCRSKSGKGAWLWLFVKEEAGFASVDVRRLLAKYAKVLNLTGELEVFPKQDVLAPGQRGNGVNLPYGHARVAVAFGRNGEELDLTGFLGLAEERRSFAAVLVARDLAGTPPAGEKSRGDRPLPAEVIRELHEKNLEALRQSQLGNRNSTLNTAAFFAARAFAAGTLPGTAEDVQQRLAVIAQERGMPAHEVESTLRSAWGTGSASPLQVFNAQEAHDEALVRLDGIIADKDLPIQDLEAVVRDAALLTSLEYGARRKVVAGRLGLSTKILDTEVGKRRKSLRSAEDELQGSDVMLEDVEPWGEPVDGAAMLDEINALFRRYVFFSHLPDTYALAVWTVFTYAYDIFPIAPYVGITSPEKECGKTTLIEILAELVNRPIIASNFTPAAIFRAVDLHHPTLLIDELDTFLEKSGELNGILNSGHQKKSAFVYRVIGDSQELRRFSTWGPKVYGMIGNPTGTLASRSVRVRLTRKTADETVEKIPRALPPEFIRLRRQAARWARDHAENIRGHHPNTTGFVNRAADNWEPLFTIAEVVGKIWPEQIHLAAQVEERSDEDSVAIQLLRDIRNIFHTRKVKQLPAELLLLDLLRQAESPWHDVSGARNMELNQYQLNRLLASFSIKSQPIHVEKQLQLLVPNPGKGVRCKGYDVIQFQDAIDRYLRGEEPREVTVSRGNEILI